MKIVIASIHFGAGHTAHLKAYLSLAKECSYQAALFLDKRYMQLFNDIDEEVLFTENELLNFKPDVLWIYNTGVENKKLIKIGRHLNCKIFYVLHEPYMGLKELLKDGSYCIKEAVASVLNAWICKKSDIVVLCSNQAVINCQKYMSRAYRKSTIFPLIFPDEYVDGVERRYFSLIGGYAESHGSDEFLNFIKQSCKANNLFFQIVTRSNIEDKLKDPILQTMVRLGRLIVQQGRPLTEDEMNHAYRCSICTWNGYKRSTQSGVLANSYMQGTPVIATHTGSFEEYVRDGENGVFIKNFEYNEILAGYQKIEKNIKNMEKNCRETFWQHFSYKNQVETFKRIISKQ